MEIVEALPSDTSPLVLGKEYDIVPNMISRWKKQYLEGKFHGLVVVKKNIEDVVTRIFNLSLSSV